MRKILSRSLAGLVMLATAVPAAVPAAAPVIVVPVPGQAPVKEGYVDVPGARLWYWDTGGPGTPVVLMHPATGSGASWEYQQPVFAQAGYRVIGYSRRGHYRSAVVPDTSGETQSVAASEDLHALTEVLGLERFHLLGSAAGSIAAADYVLSHPGSVLSVVLASTVLGVQDPDILAASRRLLPQTFNSLPPEFRELGPSYRAANPAGTQRWLAIEKAARPSGGGRFPVRNVVTLPALAATGLPILLLTGDGDLYMPPALLLDIAGRVPNSEFVLIDNAGHAAFWEQPEAFNRAVLEFFGRHDAAAGR